MRSGTCRVAKPMVARQYCSMNEWFGIVGFWSTIASLAIGVAGWLYAWRVARRGVTKLLISHSVTPLRGQGPDTETLQIQHGPEWVSDPHLATFRVENVGGRALRPDDCPPRKGEPQGGLRLFSVRFPGARILSMTVVKDGKPVGGGGHGDRWDVNAPHLPAGSVMQWTAVVDGPLTGPPELDELMDVTVKHRNG